MAQPHMNPAEREKRLLVRAGLLVEDVYGDFHRHPLGDNSSEMVWIARRLLLDT